MAELTGSAADERPFPPGDYPVVVDRLRTRRRSRWRTRCGGSGSSTRSSPRIRRPGGMFRRWPLLPAPAVVDQAARAGRRAARARTSATTGTACSATSPTTRALQPEFMDGTSYFPSRPEMEANLAAFAERAGVAVRYGCRGPRRASRRTPTAGGFVVETTDGEYRAAVADRRGRRRRAVHAARPRDGAHPPLRRRPAGRELRRAARVHHRQAELRLRARQRPAAVGPPARPRLAVDRAQAVGRHALAGRRPGALRPAVRGQRPGRRRRDPRRGASSGSSRSAGGDGALAVHLRRTDGGGDARRRGRRRHLRDRLRDAAPGPAGPRRARRSAASRLPAQTPWWESATRARRCSSPARSGRAPRASSATAVPANSGAVHGARYNARVLAAAHRRRRGSGSRPERPRDRGRRTWSTSSSRELADAPELWHQRGYLARVFTADPGCRAGRRRRPAARPRPRCRRPGRARR